VRRRGLLEQVIEGAERHPEASVINQASQRTVMQRQYGEATTDVLVGFIWEAGVEGGLVQSGVETRPAEVIRRQRGKQPRGRERRVHAQAVQSSGELGIF